MTEKLEIFDVLRAFLDRVYEEASKRQNVVLKRNHGHYEYPGEKFCAYVTILPNKVELIFEGKEVSTDIFVITLDICTTDGEILNSDIVSVSGRCDEIKATLTSQEELALTQLLKFLDS
ncbi:hypothetical protein [Pseudomonas purpurea]|uniref:hypothetical protein n=1 Tax=Pseudomonas purpurea TaxID=3136737 RepID=UPI00326433CD